jgi:hypothetical protein
VADQHETVIALDGIDPAPVPSLIRSKGWGSTHDEDRNTRKENVGTRRRRERQMYIQENEINRKAVLRDDTDRTSVVVANYVTLKRRRRETEPN